MKAYISDGSVALKRIFKPQFVLFGITLMYFLSALTIALTQKDNPFIVDRWGFFSRAMTYPLLLMLSCVLVLAGRLFTVGLAMIIAGRLVYVLAFRGLIGISYAHDTNALSLPAFRLWFDVTPINLIVQTALAVIIFLLGAVHLAHLLRQRRSGRPNSNGS